MTHRIERIGDCELHLADCREVLPTLGRAKLLVTDPPYLLTSGGDTASHKAWGGWLGKSANDGRPVVCDIGWAEICRLAFSALDDDADAYIMANDKNVNEAWNAALQAGFKFHNLLVWDKRTAVQNRWYMKNCEFTIYLWKGAAKTIRDPSSKQIAVVPNLQDSAHPTIKPVPLMSHYIKNSSDPGDVVVDPFMGVGATGIACAQLGRRFIGCEIEPKYFDIACRRIEEAYKQPDMFVSAPEPKAEQLDLLGASE